MHRGLVWLGILLAFLTVNGTRLYAIKVPLEPAHEDPLPAEVEDGDVALPGSVPPKATRDTDVPHRQPFNYDVMPSPEDTEDEAKPRPEPMEIRGV